MKRWTDDMTDWQLRRENLEKPFPHIYPRMPSRFRRCRAFVGALFLLEWGCVFLMALSGLALCGTLVIRGEEAFDSCLDESALFAFLAAVFILPVLLSPVCRGLRRTPKFFWRCPCCGFSFPYYAPPLRGLDTLKEADCVHMMEHLRVRYVKEKFCPLILPSACPECGAKFFDLPDGFSAGGR